MRKIIVLTALIVGLLPTLALAQPAGGSQGFLTPGFERTWMRTDKPVQDGAVSRTWMWGPKVIGEGVLPYAEAPGGFRKMMFFDKSRMEDNTWRGTEANPVLPPWDVTNGLLVVEMMTGNVQEGDNTFEYVCPAGKSIAGDQAPENPTYQAFGKVMDTPAFSNGDMLGTTIDSDGTVGESLGFLEAYGVTAVNVGSPTNHSVASVFWDFMNSNGTVFNADSGQYEEGRLFVNPFYATGYPVTEAYWAKVMVGGGFHNVLIQAFERRVLTYTPDNPDGWQVEMGNVGRHYIRWYVFKEGRTC